MPTMTEVLARADITAPDDALADIEVPVLSVPQRQGDVLVLPRPAAGKDEMARMTEVPAAGVAVVRGETTGGNAHILHADGPVLWHAAPQSGDALTLGALHVPAGSVAWLIHTDEHGAIGIGEGTYRLHGKREQADQIRRVAD